MNKFSFNNVLFTAAIIFLLFSGCSGKKKEVVFEDAFIDIVATQVYYTKKISKVHPDDEKLVKQLVSEKTDFLLLKYKLTGESVSDFIRNHPGYFTDKSNNMKLLIRISELIQQDKLLNEV